MGRMRPSATCPSARDRGGFGCMASPRLAAGRRRGDRSGLRQSPFPSLGAGRPQFMPDPDAVSPLEGKKRRAAIKAVARIPEIGRVPNFGDLESYRRWDVGADVDLLVGGTPCQSFSVAGLRQGLDDPRGNLALVFLGLVERLRPRWVVWENVPGVLSSNKGRDLVPSSGAWDNSGMGVLPSAGRSIRPNTALRRSRPSTAAPCVRCRISWRLATSRSGIF